MTNAEAIATADAAKSALDRFLRPAFATCRTDYQAKLTALYANLDDAKVERQRVKLALALRVLNEVENQINAVVAGGDVARHEQQRANRVANLPAAKRFGIEMA